MKTLTLLRHAKSGWDDPVARDFDRPLNAKGARAAETMGRHLRGLGLAFDLVVASPAVRVQETLDHFAGGLGETLAPEWDRRLYLASEATLLDVVRALPDTAEQVLLVGHNPGLEELVLLLAEAGALRQDVAEKFPTASVAVLEVAPHWSEARDGEATLVRFIRPRDVDPSLGPDFG
ncbi:SixA phosphatase family protein [Sphingomonas desiccabilis]|uniref:Histidine phosphatase family protein n=1 Tax=Sphingomonas desiccabilis TaxID=429134 RepID=A0A4Q2ILZ2_9SPHN|nr:histidine phosphatase family protein [Sphingomonas desiccabilis]MBB3912147.1 phosphohistidine phosphatase [Sphingomonas desiccabilis]RXZ30310.1 histidine phosphatase family protein [Sphingomonas desiccabilis]